MRRNKVVWKDIFLQRERKRGEEEEGRSLKDKGEMESERTKAWDCWMERAVCQTRESLSPIRAENPAAQVNLTELFCLSPRNASNYTAGSAVTRVCVCTCVFKCVDLLSTPSMQCHWTVANQRRYGQQKDDQLLTLCLWSWAVSSTLFNDTLTTALGLTTAATRVQGLGVCLCITWICWAFVWRFGCARL